MVGGKVWDEVIRLSRLVVLYIDLPSVGGDCSVLLYSDQRGIAEDRSVQYQGKVNVRSVEGECRRRNSLIRKGQLYVIASANRQLDILTIHVRGP